MRESSTKLHVNHLVVEYPNFGTDYPIDIRLFAPESLEEITLYTNETSVGKMNEIVNSEQCKRLKMLTISTNLSSSEFPFESFIGVPRFTIVSYGRHDVVKVAEFSKVIADFVQK